MLDLSTYLNTDATTIPTSCGPSHSCGGGRLLG